MTPARQQNSAPPALVSNLYDDTYGTFPPVSTAGTGDSVVELPVGATAGIVSSTHNGSGNFAIVDLDANIQPTLDLLANTIGTYTGGAPYGISGLGTPVRLQITADGDWTLNIVPISAAAPLTLPVDAVGSGVYLYDGAAVTVAMTHQGQGNFAVMQYGGLVPGFPVNTIGAYIGTVALTAGPAVPVVTADGNYSITNA